MPLAPAQSAPFPRFHPSGAVAAGYRTVQKCGFSFHLCLPGRFLQHGMRCHLPLPPTEETCPSGGTGESLHGSEDFGRVQFPLPAILRSTIGFLITEIDGLGMAAIVSPQENRGVHLPKSPRRTDRCFDAYFLCKTGSKLFNCNFGAAISHGLTHRRFNQIKQFFCPVNKICIEVIRRKGIIVDTV